MIISFELPNLTIIYEDDRAQFHGCCQTFFQYDNDKEFKTCFFEMQHNSVTCDQETDSMICDLSTDLDFLEMKLEKTRFLLNSHPKSHTIQHG